MLAEVVVVDDWEAIESLNTSLSSIVGGKSILISCFIGGSSVIGYKKEVEFGMKSNNGICIKVKVKVNVKRKRTKEKKKKEGYKRRKTCKFCYCTQSAKSNP